jgi:hypothetical protein
VTIFVFAQPFPRNRSKVSTTFPSANGDAMVHVVVYLDRAPFTKCIGLKGDVVQLAGDNP